MKTQDSKIVKARRQIFEQIVKLSKSGDLPQGYTSLIKIASLIMDKKNV